MAIESAGIDVVVNNLGSWPVQEDLLARGCREALNAEGIGEGEVSVTLMDDEGIRGLNQEYFGKSRPADVIAFSLQAPGDPVLGDIYLGYEQARRQSDELDILLDEELLRLVIHGTLHVLGYQHPDGEERLESPMFMKQEELLRRVLESEAARE